MTTVQQIFDMAIHLMDEQNESNGQTVTQDTKEYRSRTISILNSVIPVLQPYNSNYTPSYGRPRVRQLAWDNYNEPNFQQSIPLDDALSLGLLPYYLAAQLLSAENETLSAWFMNRYREFFMEIRDKVPAQFEKIVSPYGGF
jgi:hypothetical protein